MADAVADKKKRLPYFTACKPACYIAM